MSKIKIKQELRIECSTEEEVKKLVKEMRTKGFHTSDIIHWSWTAEKFRVSMYSKFKTFKL